VVFIKLFCGDKKDLSKRSRRSNKSPALWLVYHGLKKSGVGPFCRYVPSLAFAL
jgi:hypothetical protein